MLSLCRMMISSEDAAISSRIGDGCALAGLSHHTSKRKCRGRNHAAQRNVACDRNHNDEQDEHNEHGARRERGKSPHGGGHSLSALEAQPDGEHVPEDGAKCGQRGQ